MDASYQVSFHLTKPFQRGRVLEINQSETRCFLTSFGSYGEAVSEEKIQM
jgi:hypothetical protein